ncbi:MAG: hypothetical protein GY820_48490 [Gammaproteobacteria bacterium]|nr:hypothetical protein [Gammaproteobacteria bacterium]
MFGPNQAKTLSEALQPHIIKEWVPKQRISTRSDNKYESYYDYKKDKIDQDAEREFLEFEFSDSEDDSDTETDADNDAGKLASYPSKGNKYLNYNGEFVRKDHSEIVCRHISYYLAKRWIKNFRQLENKENFKRELEENLYDSKKIDEKSPFYIFFSIDDKESFSKALHTIAGELKVSATATASSQPNYLV